MKSRRGFTLVEVVVAGAVGLVVLGALTFAFVGARQTQAASGRHLELLEGAVLAMHQLRADLRQLSFVPGKPVEPYSLRIAAGGRAVRLRRSAPSPNGTPPGSSFVVVDYRLEPAKGAEGRFNLLRSEWTASGAALLGRTRSRQEEVLRGTTLRGMTVRFREDEANNARVLHVSLDVTSTEGVLGLSGPTGAPSMVISNVLQIQRPELPFGANLPLFAEPIPAAALALAEKPPGEVLAPAAADAVPLPAF